jgi:hypothetical protein
MFQVEMVVKRANSGIVYGDQLYVTGSHPVCMERPRPFGFHDAFGGMPRFALQNVGDLVNHHMRHDVRLMLGTLLAERFALKTRTGNRQLPVYTLVVAKSGSKLHESKPAESSATSSSDRSVNANKITLQILATLLSGQLDRPVVDSTGLTGTFDINLEWTPDASESDSVPLSGPSLGAALQEQLATFRRKMAAFEPRRLSFV